MRDIERIDKFLAKVGEYWKSYPDFRFGQMMINVMGQSRIDPWNLEEDDMLELFERFFKKGDQ